MRSWKTSLLAAVALASVGTAGTGGSANAQALVSIYGGGATFPSKALRLLMDCYMVQLNGGNNGTTDVAAVTLPYDGHCNGGAGNGITGLFPGDDGGTRIGVMLYAPVGSGAGKTAFRTHGMVPAPATANKIAFTDGRDARMGFAQGGNPGYPGNRMHFIGSDDVVNSTDYNVGATSYVGSGNKAKYGEWIQIPELIGPVTIAYNGTDGAGAPLVGAGPGGSLNLSRKSFCGIFSGHINKWNDASLVADNPGLSTATGAIKVVHRSDGSGTNFIFTNALVHQCSSPTGAGGVPFGIDDSVAGTFSYQFPWADASAADQAGRCPGAPASLEVIGANLVSWPDPGATNVCGGAVTTAAGNTFLAGSGNAGVEALMDSTISGAAANGTIGYVTPDFVSPIVPGGLPVANLQNEYDLNLSNTTSFIAPSAPAAVITMSSQIPTFANDAARANPLAWSSQLTQPNPTVQGAYPIAGFTMFGFYQCYASFDDLLTIFGYLKYHYNVGANGHGGLAAAILNGQGFAPVPGTVGVANTWLGEIATLVTQSAPIEQGPVGGTCSVAD